MVARCDGGNHFATTIEVAYHLRPLLVPTGRPALTMRAIIPEASLWEPETPHLYSGPVELWQDGASCDVVEVRHGLRHISLGPRGLRLNGRMLRLRGRAVDRLDEAEAIGLRLAGYNLLVAPVGDETGAVWEVADRIGFLVLGRWQAGVSADRLRDVARHPSCLGWLAGEDAPEAAEIPPGTFVGTERGETGAFVVTPATRLGESRLPALVRATGAEAAALMQGEAVIVGVLDEG